MDYWKRIKEYRARFKNEETIKFIDFLDVLFEWIDELIETKRLTREQEKELALHYPKKIFEELDKLSPTEIPAEKYNQLKDILMKESSDFLVEIVTKSNVRMVDFDRVQFNLYAIFGKEQIASLVEHVRDRLEKIILEQRAKEYAEEERKKREEKEWLRKVRSMGQKEMNKVILGSIFNFAPSARTPEERLEAIKNNQKRVTAQKKVFRNFELKLADATETAKIDAQNKVYRQIGEVKRGMVEITDKFREKAKDFVSEEGPKKKIRGARTVILKQKVKLHSQLKDKGKDWEKHFREETEKAQSRISKRGIELDIEIYKKGVEWKENFEVTTQKAQEEIFEQRKRLSDEEKQKKEFMAKRGESELQGARERISRGTTGFEEDIGQAKLKFAEKGSEILHSGQREITEAKENLTAGTQDFEIDVMLARKRFSGKEELMGHAREYFTEKRDVARYKFIKRGVEVETEMYGAIYKERSRFEKERAKARERFLNRGAEISGKAKAHISGKKDKFAKQRGLAGKRFLTRAENIKAKPIANKTIAGSFESGGKEASAKAELAKGRIEEEHLAMMERARLSREKMMEEVIHKRDLFLYDTRFARHNINENAQRFAEKAAAKREEFGTRGGQIVSRHKARQKAHLIRNLLRTIRTMQVKQ
jgi:hypothetical protein